MSINKHFGSDNHSGVHQDILKAIIDANINHDIAYGEDYYTQKAVKKFKQHFGNNVDVYFVYNGTAANILGLKTLTNSFNSIICAETAHLNVHECCGPEKFTGCKLITIPTSDGKLTVDMIEPHMIGFGDPHRAQPKVISITQPTELGTVYTKKEIKNLSNFAHNQGMLIHIDGARLCNAAAYLQLGLKEITTDVGVDLLSFGGTKNGMMFGEAVVFFNKNLSKNFEYIRKQGMQLASKMRFISVQFEALLSNDLWLKNADHSNKMTKILYEEIKDIKKLKITQKVQTNVIFSIIPKECIIPLQKEYFFHVFDEFKSEVRWMCSFNTTNEDIKNFSNTIKRILN
jgi:threonine aldolase